jgi:ribosomal protein L11 methyltransferase
MLVCFSAGKMDNSKSPSGYTEVSLVIPRDQEELVANFIIEEIAFGLVTEDVNDGIRVIFYIPKADDATSKIEKLEKYLDLMNVPAPSGGFKIKCGEIDEIDWISQYQREFKSVDLGHIVIKTPWDKNDYNDKKIITIEPKMAFGTGKHETTRLCLDALQGEVKPGMKVLDLGTGSGILSIYALMLGAESAYGLDIDPEAVPNALENAQINGVADRFQAEHGSMDRVTCENVYDMVISNLIYDGIIELFDDFTSVLKPGGTMILSGILDEQRNDLSEYIENRISADINIIQLNEWLCYILRMK